MSFFTDIQWLVLIWFWLWLSSFSTSYWCVEITKIYWYYSEPFWWVFLFLNFLFLHVILLSEIALIVAFRSPMFTSSLRVRIHVLCFFLFNFLFCKITRLQYYMTKMLVYYITKMLRYYKKLHKKLLNYNTSIKTTPQIKKNTVLIPLIVQNYSIAVKMLVILRHTCKQVFLKQVFALVNPITLLFWVSFYSNIGRKQPPWFSP